MTTTDAISAYNEGTLSEFLAEELAGVGIAPVLAPGALREAILAAIAAQGGEVAWEQDGGVWSAYLRSPVRATFRGRTLEAALGWCLLFLRAPEAGATDDFR